MVVSPEEDPNPDGLCGLSDIGGHIMKIPIIGFQVLLCMRLEVCELICDNINCMICLLTDPNFQGTPPGARNIPLPLLFSPLFLLQGAGVLFAISRLVEKLILLLRSGSGTGIYFRFSSRAHDCFGFLHHGSR